MSDSKKDISLVDVLKEEIEKNPKNSISSRIHYETDKVLIDRIEKFFGHTNISEITTNYIATFFNSMKDCSNSYIKKNVSLMKRGFELAKSQNYIDENIFDDSMTKHISMLCNYRKRTTFPVALSITAQKRFTNLLLKTNIIKEPYKTAYLLQLYMGLRTGEISQLAPDDINFDDNIMKIDSSNEYTSRTLQIPNFLRENLMKQYNDSIQNKENYLFYNYNNAKARFMIHKIFKNYLREERILIHGLRGTYMQRHIEDMQSHNRLNDIYKTSSNKLLSMNINELLDYYENNKLKIDQNKQYILSKTKRINKKIFSKDKKGLVVNGEIDDLNYGKTLSLKDKYTIQCKKDFETLEETKSFLQGIDFLNNYINERDEENER